MEIIYSSKCCREETYEQLAIHGGIVDFCSKCKLQCEKDGVLCSACFGTKVESIDVDDGEGHSMQGVGTRPCSSCSSNDHDND